MRYPTDASDEDDCLIHTLAIAAEKIAVCYKLIYFYYIAPGSLSRSGLNLTRWLNTLKYKQDRMDYLQKINRTELVRLFLYLIGCKKLKAKSHVDFLEEL